MSDKQQMDDFASLFLPDLLHRTETQEAAPAARSRDPLPPANSTSSSGMSLLRFFEASQQPNIPVQFVETNQAPQQSLEPLKESKHVTQHVTTQNQTQNQTNNHMTSHVSQQAFSPFNQNYNQVSFARSAAPGYFGSSDNIPFENTSRAGNHGVNGTGVSNNISLEINFAPTTSSVSHCLLPFSSLDMGYMQHYADLLPPESIGLSQRQYQYPMSQFQQGYIASPHAQQDPSTWAAAMDPGLLNKSWIAQPQSFGYPLPGPGSMDMHQLTYDIAKEPGIKEESLADQATKQAKPPKSPYSKQPATSPKAPRINVDYSDRALDQLVNLKRTSLAAPSVPVSCGQTPVQFFLKGFLNGRLLSNDQDNYNYISLATGTVDLRQVYQPQVISCYRRNFINLHLHFRIDSPLSELTIGEEKILRLRVVVRAITGKEDPEPVALLDNEHEIDPKDARKASDGSQVERIGTSHTIDLAGYKRESFWRVKKLQFKSATANSTNLVFQSYYRFVVRVIAETYRESHVIDELASNPIIVRGRNPSFYHSKNDYLIKAKSPGVASSYVNTSLALPLLPRHLAGQESKSSSDKRAVNPSQSAPLGVREREAFKLEHLSPVLKIESDLSTDETGNVQGGKGLSDGDEGACKVSGSKSDTRSLQPPGNTDLQKLLDSLNENKGEKYHYFPILNVYYLPPINVVYFPHAAHHTEAVGAGEDENAPESTDEDASSTHHGSKSNSKVYFR